MAEIEYGSVPLSPKYGSSDRRCGRRRKCRPTNAGCSISPSSSGRRVFGRDSDVGLHPCRRAKGCSSSSKIPFFPDLETDFFGCNTSRYRQNCCLPYFFILMTPNATPQVSPHVSLRARIRGSSPFQNHHRHLRSPRIIFLIMSRPHPQAHLNSRHTRSRIPYSRSCSLSSLNCPILTWPPSIFSFRL